MAPLPRCLIADVEAANGPGPHGQGFSRAMQPKELAVQSEDKKRSATILAFQRPAPDPRTTKQRAIAVFMRAAHERHGRPHPLSRDIAATMTASELADDLNV